MADEIERSAGSADIQPGDERAIRQSVGRGTNGRGALDRFFAPTTFAEGTVELRDEEFHHLAHVLRKRAGDMVEVFDGRGRAARCRIAHVGKRDAQLQVEEQLQTSPVHGISLTVASAVPKGDRAKWLVEKLTELNVARWTPLISERSVVDPQGAKLDKLRQTVIAACKQCGRNHLMELDAPQPWRSWLLQPGGRSQILVADAAGEQINGVVERLTLRKIAAVCVAIGPEGGFTVAEVDAARALGADLVRLGDSILRVETAAIAAAAVLPLLLGTGTT